MPFDRILDEVKSGRAPAGLLIHEGQLTYEDEGLVKVLDLGEWWLLETGLPLPLGVNVARRDVPRLPELSAVLRESIGAGLANRQEAMAYALGFARDLAPDTADRFIAMYVNELTCDYGDEGRQAVEELLRRAEETGTYDSPCASSSSIVSRAVDPLRRAHADRALRRRARPASGRTISRRRVIAAAVARAGVDRGARSRTSTSAAANQAGEDNRNVARMAALLAGLPESVAGVTVNRLCASGLAAVVAACHAVAGRRRRPLRRRRRRVDEPRAARARRSRTSVPARRPTVYDTTLGWRFPNPRLAELFPLESMGETGENVAERWGVSREDQDAFALRSQQRWAAAAEAGRFDDELVAGRRRRRATSIRVPTRARRSSPR